LFLPPKLSSDTSEGKTVDGQEDRKKMEGQDRSDLYTADGRQKNSFMANLRQRAQGNNSISPDEPSTANLSEALNLSFLKRWATGKNGKTTESFYDGQKADL
jgi:hypothetical protein